MKDWKGMLAVAVLATALAGCTAKTTTGDRMLQHATDRQVNVDLKEQLAKDWNRGSKLVATGEKRVKDGEKRVKKAEKELSKGREAIDRGRKEMSEGTQLVADNEHHFRASFPDLAIQPPR